MPALAPLRVIGPPPQAPLYSLVSTPGILIEQPDPVHWAGGVLVDSYGPDLPTRHYPCSSGSSRIKPTAEKPPRPELPSFTVLIPITCSGIGIGNEAGAELLRTRIMDAFAARESFGVEQQLVYGDPENPGDPHLADANLDTPVGTTEQSPREAVALLEKAIGETAQQGVLHLDPATFASCPPDYFIQDGKTTRTRRGNLVIIGDGYIGAQPDPAEEEELEELPADQNWVFATGPVRATRDQIVVPKLRDVFNEETNELTFRAERNYVVYWDTNLQVGVPVDRSLTP